MTCDPEETRAIAIAGIALAYAVVGMLNRTGVLCTVTVDRTLEASLIGIENAFSPDDRAALLARQLLDLMGGQLTAHVAPRGAIRSGQQPV
jgi:hypothetical protein